MLISYKDRQLLLYEKEQFFNYQSSFPRVSSFFSQSTVISERCKAILRANAVPEVCGVAAFSWCQSIQQKDRPRSIGLLQASEGPAKKDRPLAGIYVHKFFCLGNCCHFKAIRHGWHGSRLLLQEPTLPSSQQREVSGLNKELSETKNKITELQKLKWKQGCGWSLKTRDTFS